jgi:hypothetical protein
MWKQLEKEKQKRARERSRRSRSRSPPRRPVKRKSPSPVGMKPRDHLDKKRAKTPDYFEEDGDGKQHFFETYEKSQSSNYWTKKLMKMEELDTNR